jgi:hypothetical protein
MGNISLTTWLAPLHTQVITKVVLGMELSAKDRKDFENDFQIWLKEVGRPT